MWRQRGPFRTFVLTNRPKTEWGELFVYSSQRLKVVVRLLHFLFWDCLKPTKLLSRWATVTRLAVLYFSQVPQSLHPGFGFNQIRSSNFGFPVCIEVSRNSLVICTWKFSTLPPKDKTFSRLLHVPAPQHWTGLPSSSHQNTRLATCTSSCFEAYFSSC